MKQVKCKSGVRGWKCKLREVYRSEAEFRSYAFQYDLHSRLGYSTPTQAWKANPMVEGSVNPTDFCKVK